MGEVAAVVLAAGRSTRMAPDNKLLLTDASGVTMIAHVVDAILASRANPVSVVTGHQADAVKAALGARPVQFLHAPDFATGMAASLRAGLVSLPASVEAALVCLGDMPLIGSVLIDRIIGHYDPQAGRLIVVPTCDGRRGNPILWDKRYFADMVRLTGDVGARSLLNAHKFVELDMNDPAILQDFDGPEALAVWPPPRLP